MLPKYGLVLPTEIQNQLEAVKKAKGTLVVCAKATCCHKILLILIGIYNRPACFANQTCPLKHVAQKCACMDTLTCWNWFNEVFYPDVRRRTFHPVLSLMDNALI